jgi:hypothetical protein
MFHTGTMSLLPIVSSTGRPSMRNLTGLNGSMRPVPQSGLFRIHTSCSLARRNARRVPGMIAKRISNRSMSGSR